MGFGKKTKQILRGLLPQASDPVKSLPPNQGRGGKQALPRDLNDLPPPYSLENHFSEAGIKEDELEILKDYETIVLVDDSGSMMGNNGLLWKMVNTLSPRS